MLVRFGLFAIRRSDTTKDAMFDPDVCGAFVCIGVESLFIAVCESEGKCL